MWERHLRQGTVPQLYEARFSDTAALTSGIVTAAIYGRDAKNRDANDRDTKDKDAKNRDAKNRDATNRNAKNRDAKNREAKNRDVKEDRERERERERGFSSHAVQSFFFSGNRVAQVHFRVYVCAPPGFLETSTEIARVAQSWT